jgi:hypothetical protein
MHDREKILAEIERRIEDSNNIGFVEGECGYRTGLRDIRDFIANLPAAEEVPMSAVYFQDRIEAAFVENCEAHEYIDGHDDMPIIKVAVSIRPVEDRT